MIEKLQIVSENNDFDYYLNKANVGNQDLVLEIIEYFESGPRKDLFEPLQFLNLFWKQFNFFDSNVGTPFHTIGTLLNLPLSDEEKHVLFGFILKFYGGYPVQKINVQHSIALQLLEKVFLVLCANSPERSFCLAPSANGVVPEHELNFASKYRYSAKDFLGMSDENGLDFYFNLGNVPYQDLMFDTMHYFESGDGKGFIEPLAFFNLLWKQYKFVEANVQAPNKVIKSLAALYLTDQQRFVLYGFIVKWFKREALNKFNDQLTTTIRLIQKEFSKIDPPTRGAEYYFEDDRTNEEIFLSKFETNPLSRFEFKSADELLVMMWKYSNFEFEKWRDNIESKIKTFPGLKQQILQKELQQCEVNFETVRHSYLPPDDILRDFEKLSKSFKDQIDIMYHLSASVLNELRAVIIERITLFQKIDFLSLSIDGNSEELDDWSPTHSDSKIIVDKNGLRESVRRTLTPLSGSWNGNAKMTSADFSKMIEEVLLLIHSETLPSRETTLNIPGFTMAFIRKTFNVVYKDHFPGRNSKKRTLWVDFLHNNFSQFKNTAKETTSRKFTEYTGSYEADCKLVKLL